MRLLWLAPVHYQAGVDVHPAPWISALASSLRESYGLSIHILNYAPRLSRQQVHFEKDGIQYTFLKTPAPKWDHLGLFRKRIGIIRQYLDTHRDTYDMIHVHGSEHQYEACVTGTDIPHVISMQGVMGACLKQLKQRYTYTHLSWWMSARYEQFYLPKVENFICRTHFDTGFVKRCNPKARVHENWEMIRPEFFADLGDEQPKSILYMGGTHPIKGLSLTLQAMEIIVQHQAIKLQILGKAHATEVKDLIEELGLQHIKVEDIVFLGFQQVQGVVAAMDKSYIMLHTSLIDNSPNSVCEAQVAGLPVVCTDVGGTASLIEHGRTGMLATLDPSDIADKALALLRNPELHATLKRESRTMARQRHDQVNIAKRTMEIYREVLDAHENHYTDIQSHAKATVGVEPSA